MKCIKCGKNEAEICIACHTFDRIFKKRKFKKIVFERANYKCEMCGESDRECLTVHHIDKKTHIFNPDKAQCLCMNCHFGRVHKKVSDDV